MTLEDQIPEHLIGGMKRYVENGCPTGSFLQAVFENNFLTAVLSADPVSFEALRDIASWVQCSPQACNGSPKAYREWIKHGGSEGERING